jgi:hypothetical protein
MQVSLRRISVLLDEALTVVQCERGIPLILHRTAQQALHVTLDVAMTVEHDMELPL